MARRHTTVAVIGAGPYGLSVAAHLSHRGVPHRIFGSPMSLWSEHMPPGMFLKSEGHASDLGDPAGVRTLEAYARETGTRYAASGVPVPIRDFVDYGLWFQRHLVPHVEPVQVTAVRRDGEVFELELDSGEVLTADRVVVAVGVGAFRRLPEAIADLPDSLASHTADHADLTRFADRRVLVLGGGQGALETAALLHEAGARSGVLVRADRVEWNAAPTARTLGTRLRWPQSTLGTGWRTRFYAQTPGAFRWLPAATRATAVRTALGPAGSWWLRHRVEGVLEVSVGSVVTAARQVGEAVELTIRGPGGTGTVMVDHVMAGTGFQVEVDRLAFLAPELRAHVVTYDGYPVLDGWFQSSVRRLHFAGLSAAGSFGPVQRFVAGAGYAASRIAAGAGRRPRSSRGTPAARRTGADRPVPSRPLAGHGAD